MTLLNILKTNPDMRKIFGTREIKIIEKQLLGVNLSPSEITRLSRDIRKKFDAINKLIPFENDFKLKKGAQLNEIIKESIEIILSSKYANKIKKIILYGSTIDKKLTLFSDIDISVKFTDINIKEATDFRINVMGQTQKRVDIQVYNTLPNKIKKEINEKGRIIYERKNK